MKLFYYIALILFISVSAYSQIALQEFKAISIGRGVSISWKSTSEANFKSYDLERSNDGINFKAIKQGIEPKGDENSYQLLDEEVFKQDSETNEIQQNGKYFYRLKVNYKDGTSSRSDEISVIHQPSSIRKTWGMLKEMFK